MVEGCMIVGESEEILGVHFKGQVVRLKDFFSYEEKNKK
jgi:hypothetical protein